MSHVALVLEMPEIKKYIMYFITNIALFIYFENYLIGITIPFHNNSETFGIQEPLF